MFLSDINPLHSLPGISTGVARNALLVLELVGHVRLPGDVFLVDWNTHRLVLVGDVLDGVRVSEDTLGDQSTRDRISLLVKGLWGARHIVNDSNTCQVCVSRDRSALTEVVNGLSHELLVTLRFHIASVILVEVVKLVVHEDRSFHGLLDVDSHCAICSYACHVVQLSSCELEFAVSI